MELLIPELVLLNEVIVLVSSRGLDGREIGVPGSENCDSEAARVKFLITRSGWEDSARHTVRELDMVLVVHLVLRLLFPFLVLRQQRCDSADDNVRVHPKERDIKEHYTNDTL